MLPPRLWPRAALTLARTFGARGIVYRAVHEARRAGSGFRAAPRATPAGGAAPLPFAVDAARLAGATDGAEALRRGERVLAGEYQAYRGPWRTLPATPAEWLRNPVTGWRYDGAAPWWKVESLDAAAGDIKDLWEPARFGWAYDLVRAHLLTGDPRFAAAFHARLADWEASSPPFRGPHWSCGQETAVRAAALLYAEANLPASDAERARLAALLGASGERIADAFGCAVSQRNNHAVSEAAGMVLLGARLEGSHPDAGAWLRRGEEWLERLVAEQFAEDGWYIQHSLTYARLALTQLVLAQRVLRARGAGLSAAATARVAAAARLLTLLADPATGGVPNHGANDGADVHPVSLAPYGDFRPVLTAVAAAFGLPLAAGLDADRETLAWLGMAAPAPGPAVGDGAWFGPSGWAVARVGPACVFLRAGGYRSRPGHIDPLHLDVRFGGRGVVVDPGTFAYNAPPPWRNGLAGAALHNGPVVDGREPGIRGPRFLWYVWPEAELLEAAHDGAAAVLRARTPGVCVRTVRVRPDVVEVEDEVLAGRHAAVRWLLHPDADPASVEVVGGAEVRAAVEGDPAGWYSPGYGTRLPSRRVEALRDVAPGERIVTHIHAPAPAAGPRSASPALTDTMDR